MICLLRGLTRVKVMCVLSGSRGSKGPRAFHYAALVIGLLLVLRTLAVAQPHHLEPASNIGIAGANTLLQDGDFASAERVARSILLTATAERAEAYRVLGLALFYQQRIPEARSVFLEFLRANPDAHLDPVLVPPEAITILEDVRARHLAEIEASRPKPKKRRFAALNLLPAAGQFQNGDTTKGVVIVASMGLLLAANVGTYYWLRGECDKRTRVCGDPNGNSAKTARGVQNANALSGVALLAVYAYSLVDGYLGYRAVGAQEDAMEDAQSTRGHFVIGVLANARGASAQWQVLF